MEISSLRSLTLKDFYPVNHWTDPLTSTSDKMKNLAKNLLILPFAKEFFLLRTWKNQIQIISSAIKAPWMNPESQSILLKDNVPHVVQAVLSAFGFTLLYFGDSFDIGFNFDSGYTIGSIINNVYSIFNEYSLTNDSIFNLSLFRNESPTVLLTDDNILNAYSLFFIGAATCTLGLYLLYYPSSSIFHWNEGPPPLPPRDHDSVKEQKEHQNKKLQARGRGALPDPTQSQSQTALQLPTFSTKQRGSQSGTALQSPEVLKEERKKQKREKGVQSRIEIDKKKSLQLDSAASPSDTLKKRLLPRDGKKKISSRTTFSRVKGMFNFGQKDK